MIFVLNSSKLVQTKINSTNFLSNINIINFYKLIFNPKNNHKIVSLVPSCQIYYKISIKYIYIYIILINKYFKF